MYMSRLIEEALEFWCEYSHRMRRGRDEVFDCFRVVYMRRRIQESFECWCYYWRRMHKGRGTVVARFRREVSK